MRLSVAPPLPNAYSLPMTNNLASFALQAEDVDRARSFYEAVFNWRFELWGPPGFYLNHTGDEMSPGIQGLLHRRREPRTGTGLNGFEPTFSVEDIDFIAAAVNANGGQVVMPKSVIPSVGVSIRFLDTEGNEIGAMQYDSLPHT
jgi:predicted enzyme related to lactoylglutathione lyase